MASFCLGFTTNLAQSLQTFPQNQQALTLEVCLLVAERGSLNTRVLQSVFCILKATEYFPLFFVVLVIKFVSSYSCIFSSGQAAKEVGKLVTSIYQLWPSQLSVCVCLCVVDQRHSSVSL